MIAIKRLQNILWIIVVACGALAAYLISLRVATERNAVEALERRIYSARADMRYLEIEYEARTNMRQLEQWNADVYRYVSPQAAQYLPGERALAHLDRVEPNGQMYVAPPVMMAMAEGDDEGGTPSVAAAAVDSPAASQITETPPVRTAGVVSGPASAPVSVKAESATAAAPARLAAASPVTAAGKAKVKAEVAAGSADRASEQRMAMLEQMLLDDRTLRDLGARAAAERIASAR